MMRRASHRCLEASGMFQEYAAKLSLVADQCRQLQQVHSMPIKVKEKMVVAATIKKMSSPWMGGLTMMMMDCVADVDDEDGVEREAGTDYCCSKQLTTGLMVSYCCFEQPTSPWELLMKTLIVSMLLSNVDDDFVAVESLFLMTFAYELWTDVGHVHAELRLFSCQSGNICANGKLGTDSDEFYPLDNFPPIIHPCFCINIRDCDEPSA